MPRSDSAGELGGDVRGVPDFPGRGRARFEVRGVTLFEIRDGLIVAGTLYVEEVEGVEDVEEAEDVDDVEHPQRQSAGIEDAVEGMSGARPE